MESNILSDKVDFEKMMFMVRDNIPFDIATEELKNEFFYYIGRHGAFGMPYVSVSKVDNVFKVSYED